MIWSLTNRGRSDCNDISPAIGVSGTGVIDPATGLWYLTSKTYDDRVSTSTTYVLLMEWTNIARHSSKALFLVQVAPLVASMVATISTPLAPMISPKPPTFHDQFTALCSETIRIASSSQVINISDRRCCKWETTYTQDGLPTAFNTITLARLSAFTRPLEQLSKPLLHKEARSQIPFLEAVSG